MNCPICGTDSGKFKLCFNCYKLFFLNEIIEFKECNRIKERSKYDKLRCPECFVYQQRLNGTYLPPNPYTKFKSKQDKHVEEDINSILSNDKMKKFSKFVKEADRKEKKKRGMKSDGGVF
jgi:hypothetical protein